MNTYWDFRTGTARADSTSSGEWQVTLHVVARKLVFDSAGVETELPVNEWVDTGVFGPGEGRDELV